MVQGNGVRREPGDDVGVSQPDNEQDNVDRPAYVAGSYLGVLAAIADRRDSSVVLTVQQPDQPVHAHIGQRYRAVIMPIKQDNAPPVPPAFAPPSADRQAGA